MNDPLLIINDLSVVFKNSEENSKAISNVSFKVNKGELVAVVGESGSGKSVTAMSVLKLIPTPPASYTSGEILYYTPQKITDLLQLDEKEIQDVRGRQISMIFQEPMTSLNPVQTCGDQVMEVILLHEKISARDARLKTIELFNKVKLPDPASILKRYPHELSGGQKQRVMIAMAISCNPSLLIADEPTTALDVTVQKTILNLIKDLQQQLGMSVIYITHDLGLVAEIADSVVVMLRGSVVESGTAKQVFTAPSHPYTKALLACRPAAQPKGKRLPVVRDFMKENFSAAETSAEHFHETTLTAQTNITSDQTLLSVKNLVVNFSARKNFFGKTISYYSAVNDVSFNVRRGETLGVVGESGCGKTTLGRALLRLIEPASGSINFDGVNIADLDSHQMRLLRKNIQIIFQDPYGSLNPRITIGSAIVEPMQVHNIYSTNRQRREKAIELLEKVDLKAAHFNRYPHEFSGGQRQRICIARALGLNPGFIVCDESVSALDVSVQAQVLNLLNDLRKEMGFTSIFISHDLGVVKYISDRIMVMFKGKIIETGTAEEVYNFPKEKYTQDLIAAIPNGEVLKF